MSLETWVGWNGFYLVREKIVNIKFQNPVILSQAKWFMIPEDKLYFYLENAFQKQNQWP